MINMENTMLIFDTKSKTDIAELQNIVKVLCLICKWKHYSSIVRSIVEM